MNTIIIFFKSAVLSLIPNMGLKFLQDNPDLTKHIYVFMLSIFISLYAIAVFIISSAGFFNKADPYLADFPEFNIVNGEVKTEFGCNREWTGSDKELTVLFRTCDEEINTDIPENTFLITKNHISFMKKSGEIRTFPAGIMGDFTVSKENIISWLKYLYIPFLFIVILTINIFNFVKFTLQVFIFNYFFYILSKIFKNTKTKLLKGLAYLAIVPSAIFTQLESLHESLESIGWYVLFAYTFFYIILYIYFVKKNRLQFS